MRAFFAMLSPIALEPEYDEPIQRAITDPKKFNILQWGGLGKTCYSPQ